MKVLGGFAILGPSRMATGPRPLALSGGRFEVIYPTSIPLYESEAEAQAAAEQYVASLSAVTVESLEIRSKGQLGYQFDVIFRPEAEAQGGGGGATFDQSGRNQNTTLAPLPPEEEKKAAVWPWVLGGVAALGLLGAVIWAATRKKGRRPKARRRT